jgi:predicted DNA-binding transcriptional regulator AlpA
MAQQIKDSALPPSVRNFEAMPDSARINVTAVSILTGRSTASVWRDVKAKRLPAPVRSGLRCTRWVVGEIRQALQGQIGGAK